MRLLKRGKKILGVTLNRCFGISRVRGERGGKMEDMEEHDERENERLLQ